MICQTPGDAFNAGLADADGDPPPPPELTSRVAAILPPRPDTPGSQDPGSQDPAA